MKQLNNVMSIRMKVKLSGRGGINRNGTVGAYQYNAATSGRGDRLTNLKEANNFSLLKANYYDDGVGKDEDGKEFKKTRRVVKIDSNCNRKILFGKNTVANTPADSYTDYELKNFLTHSDTVLRGHLLAKSGCKRKSPLMVTDAEVINGAIPALSVISTSGARCDTAFAMKETIGKTEYSMDVHLDLPELQFISFSEVHGRKYVPDHLQAAFVDAMMERGVIDKGKSAYHLRYGTSTRGEIGIMLTNSAVSDLVKTVLKYIIGFYEYRADAYVEFGEVAEVSVHYDNGNTDKISIAELMDADITVGEKYIETSLDEAETGETVFHEYLEAHKKSNKPPKDENGKKGGKKKPNGNDGNQEQPD